MEEGRSTGHWNNPANSREVAVGGREGGRERGREGGGSLVG